MTASVRARRVVLGMLFVNVAGAVGLAAALVAPSDLRGTVAVVAVLVVHTVAHASALRVAVSPWVEERARGLVVASLLVATAGALPVLDATAGPGDEPGAWLLGFTVGALVVLRAWAAAAAGGAGSVLLVVLGAEVRDTLVFAGLSALLSAGFTLLLVWMLDLLRQAEDGRAAVAGLAVADERLRVARELHDVLGHRLGVIALRAELAGDHATQDLASRTLHEVRAALQGYATADLPEQLRGAELVLGSAGVAVTVRAAAPVVAPGPSQLLAAAVREAVTNVLAHSAARRCAIELREDDDHVRLTVSNDGVGDGGVTGGGGPDGGGTGQAGGGTGLSGLAERARLVGARLRVDVEGGEFRLVVEVPRR